MSDSPQTTLLIKQVIAGRQEAFATLIEEHQDMVLSVCYSLLKNPSESEDAAQDIFIKVYRNLHTFQFESAFSTWLYRIVYRHCLDLLKKPQRSRTQSWDALQERLGDESEPREPIRMDDTPAISVEEVQGILKQLSPEYQLVLTLREVQELSYEEIAQTTGMTVESVRARLRRAREALQEKARHYLERRPV